MIERPTVTNNIIRCAREIDDIAQSNPDFVYFLNTKSASLLAYLLPVT
jgi:hypothetical protein